MRRRALLGAASAGLAALTAGRPLGLRALAQESWPDRPIRLIVPYPPGGGTDMVGRAVASGITKSTGWNIVIDNRPGAGGNLGLDALAKSAADGYTIAVGQTSNLAINPSLYPLMPYEPLRDLTFVSLLARQPVVLVVRRDSPFRSLADVLAAAKAKPGELTAGHPGSGTVGHLVGEMLAHRTGVQWTEVPYRGAAQVATDLLAGRVDLYFANPPSVRGFLDSGDLRALAVTSAERMPVLPAVPTIAESGFPGFEALNWTGLVAPARLPAPILDRLNAEARKALQLDEVRSQFAGEGMTPLGSSPEEFRRYVADEIPKWREIVQAAQVQVD
ncbi:tripartite tricarboxylate transporter substrate binding protein [Roseomonas sp. NAR14]|uniref:Tripartite tricarboxylate transporter substrate binding protein n=1 Tax=Roseomonas acroporae TaxID=2937791 RepID=A0A9X1Y8G1_9PROT|nr:tripartite tricarboxylate transporter substrate binding protein [Roseomonas acroporae]MCK8786064.1 tripartite tricarboxylate transporter substrate binding protein [Roseomonas acroporae]